MKHREVELYELYYLTDRCDAQAAAAHEADERKRMARADADTAPLEELEAAAAILDKVSSGE